jgi:hypothetical protein
MLFTVIPEVDGNFKQAADAIDRTECKEDLFFQWNLCPGSMGIWPDPFYIDRHARKYAGMEFSDLYLAQSQIPHNLLFVRGAHEDHFWLRRRREAGVGLELIPGLFWLADGYQTILHENMRVTGLGGVYSPQYYDEEEGWKTKLRAYRRRQVEKACSSGQTDVLLIHEHPKAVGIKEIVFATRPQLIIYPSKDGEYHDANPFKKEGIQCCGIPRGHDPVPFEWSEGKIRRKG